MALTVTPLGRPLANDLAIETALSTTLKTNVFMGPCSPQCFQITKASGGSNAASVKLYDDDGTGVSLGTTGPNLILPIPNGGSLTVFIDGGLYFEEGFSMAAAEENGKVVTTAPDSNVTVRVIV